VFVVDTISRFHVLTAGRCIMNKRPASKDRSWMCQPRLPGVERTSLRAGIALVEVQRPHGALLRQRSRRMMYAQDDWRLVLL
jgi:hypothetical protein